MSPNKPLKASQPSEAGIHQSDAGGNKAPAAFPCRDMAEVRREIDRIDRLVVTLLAERLNYIEQAGRIKTARGSVRDTARIEDVAAKVRAEAKLNGASPDLVEKIYRAMMECCIEYEFTVFDAKA